MVKSKFIASVFSSFWPLPFGEDPFLASHFAVALIEGIRLCHAGCVRSRFSTRRNTTGTPSLESSTSLWAVPPRKIELQWKFTLKRTVQTFKAPSDGPQFFRVWQVRSRNRSRAFATSSSEGHITIAEAQTSYLYGLFIQTWRRNQPP